MIRENDGSMVTAKATAKDELANRSIIQAPCNNRARYIKGRSYGYCSFNQDILVPLPSCLPFVLLFDLSHST